MVWTAEFASLGNVLSLDNYFTKEMQEDFLPNSVQACYYNNSIYAVPSRIDAPLLYYRSDIISIPPKTWDEMLQLIKSNKDYPSINYGYIFQGYTYEGLVCNALEFIWNNGGHVTDNNGNIKINSQEAREALQVFVDIANSNNSKDAFNFQEDDSWVAFQDGSALFMRNWPYVYKQLSGISSKMRGKFDIAPLPIGPSGSESTGTLGGWNFMINKNTKDPDTAWTFVKWMSSYQSQLTDSILAGSIPTRKAVYDDPNFIAELPWISDYKEIFENAEIRPAAPNYSLVSASMQNNFKAALTKRIPVDEALANIETDLNKIYDNNKK
jgi:multiple sugar transport system substrate-binding protein